VKPCCARDYEDGILYCVSINTLNIKWENSSYHTSACNLSYIGISFG